MSYIPSKIYDLNIALLPRVKYSATITTSPFHLNTVFSTTFPKSVGVDWTILNTSTTYIVQVFVDGLEVDVQANSVESQENTPFVDLYINSSASYQIRVGAIPWSVIFG